MACKAVIVAAGYGTRFLPVTKVIPKELLPIVDRPAIDLVVSELVEAGIRDVLVITSRRKRALEDWFDRDPELEAVFGAEKASAKLEKIRPPDLRVQFVRQTAMLGTGHALLLARDFAGDDPVIVAYPDDLFGAPNCSAELLAEHARTGGSVMSAQVLPDSEDVSRYGVFALGAITGKSAQVTGFVEKPAPGAEPSRWISLGRYLYTPEVFARLAAHYARHSGPGEFYHVGAIRELAAEGKVYAVNTSAPRWDTGAPMGYLQTVIDHALRDPALGAELAAWLRARLG